MKRILTLILCAALCASLLCVPVSASGVTGAEAVHTLETLGLVRGSAAGFEPERSATRAEAAVMLLRLMGKEEAALASGTMPPIGTMVVFTATFTDGLLADTAVEETALYW